MARRSSLAEQIAARYAQVLERIHQAALRAGRDPQEVRLVVVTKGQPMERIQAVVAQGATDLGENYPEEAVAKMDALQRYDLRWHMIGHLQRRKARLVVERFDWLHSLDRVKLAHRLENLCTQAHRILRGRAPSSGGYAACGTSSLGGSLRLPGTNCPWV